MMVTLLGTAGAIAEQRPDGESAPAVPDELIEQRVAELDDERFAVRERAKAALLEIGKPAVDSLLKAAKSDSPERRIRARELVEAIRFRSLSGRFQALGDQAEEDLDVEHGMWVVALILDPDLEKKTITARLDAMAAAIRKEIGNAKPASLPPAKFMEIFTGVLKEDFGLRGDEATYHHPDNSSVHRVMERKKGLPILLSEIAVAVGRRLEVPIVGLGIPGRYMFKYDGAQAPEGQIKEDIIVDPFGGWVEVSPAQLAQAIAGFDPRTDLLPSPRRVTLVRMLNNLRSDAFEQRQFRLAEAVGAYQLLLNPHGFGLP